MCACGGWCTCFITSRESLEKVCKSTLPRQNRVCKFAKCMVSKRVLCILCFSLPRVANNYRDAQASGPKGQRRILKRRRK